MIIISAQFEKKKLHLIAITNSKFLKLTVSDMYYHIRCMHVKYPLNRDNRFDKTVITKKYLNCINLQLAVRILKNHAFRTRTTPSRTFRPILRSIGLLDNELPQKEIISTDDRHRARQQ